MTTVNIQLMINTANKLKTLRISLTNKRKLGRKIKTLSTMMKWNMVMNSMIKKNASIKLK